MGVFFRRNWQVGLFAPGVLLVQFFEKWHAPLAARSRIETLTELGGHFRVLTLQVGAKLPQAYPVTQTNMIVGMHMKKAIGNRQ